MTTENGNPELQALFAEASLDLDDRAFTDQVMSRTRRFIYHVIAVLISLLVALLIAAWWFGMPVQKLGLLITQFLATPLIDLGDNWAGWLSTPVNNVAALFVLVGRLLRLAWKKLVAASYD